MTLTLDEVLVLVGRLDDGPGFDTARERFRRFLLERLTDAHSARTLVEQCQHSPSDQHRRALQDIVTLIGRCLGFQTHFASYLPPQGFPKHDGRWHGRRLDVTVEIWADQTQMTALDAVPAAMPSHAADARSLKLCLLTPVCATRAHVDGLFQAARSESPIRIMTLRSLLALAEMIGSGRLAHEDVVRLLDSAGDLEFVIELLERPVATEQAKSSSTARSTSAPAQAEAGYWVATAFGDDAATAEHMISLDVGVRHELDIVDDGTPDHMAQPGDWICFYVPGTGIVGHCEVRALGDRRSMAADPRRFAQSLQLDQIVLHLDVPLSLREEVHLRLRAQDTRDRSGWWLTRITRQEFIAETASQERDLYRTRSVNEPTRVTVSAEDSRSHE